MNNHMRMAVRALAATALLLAVSIAHPSVASAQCGTGVQTSDCAAPSGAIFDLDNTPTGGTVLDTLTTFSTTFVGDGSTEYVSFAFRESPAWFLFDDPSVTTGGGPNLLADTDFSGATVGQNCNHENSLGCPAGWGAWIQPVDVSAIGQVNSTTSVGGCGGEYTTVTGNFWCDGSVQGYDGIYQAIATTAGATYTISWELDDNSNQDITSSGLSTLGFQIDMLVYAGDDIPVGTVSIGPPPPPPPPPGTPEPSSLLMLGIGLAAVLFVSSKQMLRNSA